MNLGCLSLPSVFQTNLERRTRISSKDGSRHYCGQKDGRLIVKIGPLLLIFMISSRIVPNYELPPNLEKVEILRVVIRENITEVVRTFLSEFCVVSFTLF